MVFKTKIRLLGQNNIRISTLASLDIFLQPSSLHHLFLLRSYPTFSNYHADRMVEIQKMNSKKHQLSLVSLRRYEKYLGLILVQLIQPVHSSALRPILQKELPVGSSSIYDYLPRAAAIVAATSASKSFEAFSIPSPTSKRANSTTEAFTKFK